MSDKLRWMCRRGMKELDLLMVSYYERGFPSASAQRKIAFETLLTYQDPIIIDLLMGKIEDDKAEVQSLIEELKTYQVDRAKA